MYWTNFKLLCLVILYDPQETDSRSAPVVIWLQGGPGSSSLFGQFELHGPYAAVANECGQVKVRRNPNTWVKKANVIYIDNPVGVGKTSECALIRLVYCHSWSHLR